MSQDKLIITIFAEDRPGVVQRVSDTIVRHNGNWLESSLSRLCGQFAGIVHIDVPEQDADSLLSSLAKLSERGIRVTRQSGAGYQAEGDAIDLLEIIVEANDRPGIIGEISSALANAKVNVEHMETECESASMAGYELFRAHLLVALPEGFGVDDLENVLEDVSDDLTVSISTD